MDRCTIADGQMDEWHFFLHVGIYLGCFNYVCVQCPWVFWKAHLHKMHNVLSWMFRATPSADVPPIDVLSFTHLSWENRPIKASAHNELIGWTESGGAWCIRALSTLNLFLKASTGADLIGTCPQTHDLLTWTGSCLGAQSIQISYKIHRQLCNRLRW